MNWPNSAGVIGSASAPWFSYPAPGGRAVEFSDDAGPAYPGAYLEARTLEVFRDLTCRHMFLECKLRLLVQPAAQGNEVRCDALYDVIYFRVCNQVSFPV